MDCSDTAIRTGTCCALGLLLSQRSHDLISLRLLWPIQDRSTRCLIRLLGPCFKTGRSESRPTHCQSIATNLPRAPNVAHPHFTRPSQHPIRWKLYKHQGLPQLVASKSKFKNAELKTAWPNVWTLEAASAFFKTPKGDSTFASQCLADSSRDASSVASHH